MMTAAPLPDFDPDFDSSPAQWAAMYRACGLQVIPCYMPREAAAWKRPKLAEWADLKEMLVSDNGVFCGTLWYGPQGSGYAAPAPQLVGIITGPASGAGFRHRFRRPQDSRPRPRPGGAG